MSLEKANSHTVENLECLLESFLLYYVAMESYSQ
jgi:hypothetical protein